VQVDELEVAPGVCAADGRAARSHVIAACGGRGPLGGAAVVTGVGVGTGCADVAISPSSIGVSVDPPVVEVRRG
jgi:hypothetical protein